MDKQLLIVSLLLSLMCIGTSTHAQHGYWQQSVAYTMDIDMDVQTHRFTGRQQLIYQNNSPDTLTKAYYHLYFNAFQPGSMMDVRSRTIQDPDYRVRDRISRLAPHEIGYQRVQSLTQEGAPCTYHTEGTILEVELASPILPGEQTTFAMQFEAQVPVQIRRSGRNNREGIDYSMAQWYPKLCEYDQQGWHPNPYVGREFHGVWGSFDVTIRIDSSYTVAGTGYLQAPQKIGHGYQQPGQKVKRPKGSKLAWNFVAENVHDFMWAADPDYVHRTAQVPEGPLLRFFYQPDTLTANWAVLPRYAVQAFEYINEHFGQYPYDEYAIIQGGDGGMEYPMATLITGHRSLKSLVGVTVHEALHSWYQMVLATNESLYPWMDEGFTSYADELTLQQLFPPEEPLVNPLQSAYNSYFAVVKAGIENPMSTHSDHYQTNRAYGMAAYSKGAIFLHQLGYVVGDEVRDRGLLRYFHAWKFKHPTPQAFLRIMEDASGMVLDWYLEYWMNTTRTIDYGIKRVLGQGGQTEITLERVGDMPMPIDLVVTLTDGSQQMYYLPLRLMRGAKAQEQAEIPMTQEADWPWTHPYYTFTIDVPSAEIAQIEIDPSLRMADIDRSNNRLELSTSFHFFMNGAGK